MSVATHAEAGVEGLVAPQPPRSSGRHPAVTLALRAAGPVLLLAAWYAATATGALTQDVLAGPQDVVNTFGELWADGQLPEALRVSVTRAGLGLLLGASTGLALGVASGFTRLGEELVDSSMQALRAIPFLALTSLFIVWFGIEEASKILLIGVACTFPMYINVSSGVRNVDRKVVEAASSFGLGRLAIAREVVLPGALPSIFAGLRLSTTLSVIALIAAEEINVTAGLGYLMARATDYLRTDILALCVLLYAVIGLAADLALRLAERVTMPWRRAVTIR
ncbi:ABC transporter permease [Nonomuraea spiralis]|uniref:ABC transporter permease n=1 Tax=Nonomuraea TaxID=83681 RepID=UPI000F772628|nr:ABC transporter permease [Nonomuraea sp. WAC 01424]RSN15622.1 ABC transporter permease [Nonomuraea sp. WAC 01424]